MGAADGPGAAEEMPKDSAAEGPGAAPEGPAESAPERPAASPDKPKDAAAEKPAAAPAGEPKDAAPEKPAAAPDKPKEASPDKPEEPAPEKPAAAPPEKPKAAPPAKPGQDLPELERSMTDRIAGRFGDRAKVTSAREGRVSVRAAREDVVEVAEFVRDELHFDHAESVSGVDYPQDGEIEVVYHLGSYLDPSLSSQVLALATRAPREDDPRPGEDSTSLPSLRGVFYSVEFHERECFEMLGVRFDGHPDNRRLLLPEDWADLPPLRKDFAIKGR